MWLQHPEGACWDAAWPPCSMVGRMIFPSAHADFRSHCWPFAGAVDPVGCWHLPLCNVPYNACQICLLRVGRIEVLLYCTSLIGSGYRELLRLGCQGTFTHCLVFCIQRHVPHDVIIRLSRNSDHTRGLQSGVTAKRCKPGVSQGFPCHICIPVYSQDQRVQRCEVCFWSDIADNEQSELLTCGSMQVSDTAVLIQP